MDRSLTPPPRPPLMHIKGDFWQSFPNSGAIFHGSIQVSQTHRAPVSISELNIERKEITLGTERISEWVPLSGFW